MNKTSVRIAIILFILISFIGGMIKVNKSIPERVGAIEVYASSENEVHYEIPTYDIAEEVLTEELNEVLNEDVKEVVKPYDDNTVEVLTNLLYGEARGIKSDMKKSAVIWCVLNRYDNGNYGKTIIDVATAKNQFCGYNANRVYQDMDSYYHCKDIVIDVLDRYYTEEQTGRTLPKDYLYFVAKDGDNVFTQEWKSTNYWNWSLENPYEE